MPTTPTFEHLVQTHQDLVFRTLLRLTGTREHLEDLAQEVFLRLFRALPNFRNEALLTTYLYRIVVNVAQDEWKRRRRQDRPLTSLSDPDAGWHDRLPSPDPSAEQQLATRQLGQALEHHLQSLTPAERATLILYHGEEQTYEAIALALEIPVNTVRTHLHRGRRKLRERLAADRAHRQLPSQLPSRIPTP